MPKEKIPLLRASIKALLEYIHVLLTGQKNSVKDTFLYDVETSMARVNKLSVAASRGDAQISAFLKEVDATMKEMYANATTMSDMKLITGREYEKLARLIGQVNSERAREEKRIANTKTDKTGEK